MRRSVLPLVAILCCGCAESQDIAADVPATDSGTGDTVAAKVDSNVPVDSASVDTSTEPDTAVDDSGSTPMMDSEFPDFSSPGGDSGGFPSPDGFSPGTCTMDSECTSPFNCCEKTKMRCGFNFGGVCMTF